MAAGIMAIKAIKSQKPHYRAGAMDYGNVHEIKLSCDNFKVMAATSRNGWTDRFGLHIDNIGFKPDVRIPAGEDWVEFVVKYWSRE